MKFGSLDKMIITSSYPKDYLGGSGYEFTASLGLKANVRSNKYKRSRCAIGNVKDISKIFSKFENFPYKGYERKRSKHEPTDGYSCLAIHLAKCIMRSDDLNL